MKIGIKFLGDEFEARVGEFAGQADGSVMLRYGDTVVLSAVVSSKSAVLTTDFLPLTVEFREKSYAVGNIPGGFYKREGKPTEREILTCRLIDRAIRPLFEPGFVEDTQAIVYAMSADEEHDVDILGINATSLALLISDIPFNSPVAAVKIGYKDGKLIVNPKTEEEKKELELVVAGNEKGIVMVEGRANFIPDDLFVSALRLAHEHIKVLIDFQKKVAKAVGKPKREYKVMLWNEDVIRRIASYIDVTEIFRQEGKLGRRMKEKELLEKLVEKLDDFVPPSDTYTDDERLKILSLSYFELIRRTMRKMILDEGKRVDGRGPDDIREIYIELGVLPRAHGSAIFKRGETEALVTATLGTNKDVQLVEEFGIAEEPKRFMFHYNFPPFSAGEVKPLRGPSRREIGHGYLAEKALSPLIPDESKFPYTLRLVSDILSSNGSTSMASVCGGSLALFDAGVPVEGHVAGVAMGLVMEGDRWQVITDILGDEDHIGDMDFKIAGNEKGISAVQMDIKTPGIPYEVIGKAIQKAYEARRKILDTMTRVISKPKPISPYAPKFAILQLSLDKIGLLIGPNGRNIKHIIAETGADITIDLDGTVKVFAYGENLKKALELIEYYTADIEEGKVYKARVKRILPNGALVQLLPSLQYAFLHVSHADTKRIRKITEVLRVGDEIEVKVTKIEDDGRVFVSRRELLQERRKKEEQKK